MRAKNWGFVVGCVAAVACGVGCGTYGRNLAKDAREMMDIGYTTSKKACFAFELPGDYFNLTPLGFSNLEGTFHGVGRRQVGAVPIKNKAWGLLFWGSRKFQLGTFTPEDPRDFSPEKLAELKAAGKPMPTESPRFNNGIVRMLVQDNAGYPNSFYT